MFVPRPTQSREKLASHINLFLPYRARDLYPRESWRPGWTARAAHTLAHARAGGALNRRPVAVDARTHAQRV